MNLIIFIRFPSFYIVTSNMGFYCMYSISVWFAKFYFLFTQPWAATLRSSSPVGVNIALLVAGAPYSQCWCLCVWEFLDELTQLPKFKTKTIKWRIFLKKRKAIWIYIIFEKLERPEISNVLEELCLQFAEYIFGKIFEKTISLFNYNNLILDLKWTMMPQKIHTGSCEVKSLRNMPLY